LQVICAVQHVLLAHGTVQTRANPRGFCGQKIGAMTRHPGHSRLFFHTLQNFRRRGSFHLDSTHFHHSFPWFWRNAPSKLEPTLAAARASPTHTFLPLTTRSRPAQSRPRSAPPKAGRSSAHRTRWDSPPTSVALRKTSAPAWPP